MMEHKTEWIAAFPNSDMDGCLRVVLEQHPKEIVAAFLDLGQESGMSAKTMIVPTEGLAELLRPSAERNDLALLVEDFVKVRDFAEAAFVSFPALYNRYEQMQGREPTLFVSVDGGPLQELHAGDSLTSVLPEVPSKGYLVGHGFCSREELDAPLALSWNEGPGTVRTVGTDECMVQKALAEVRTLRARSCGTCTFCREGLFQLEETLEGMTRPGTSPTQLDLMEEIGRAMDVSGMCTLGDAAAAPVLSALALSREELAAHCGRGKCPAEQCDGFRSIYIDPHKCEGAGDCMDVCPKDCIEGRPRYISMIDEFECTKCGACLAACENGAIIMTSGRVPKLPTRPTRVGRFR